MEHQSGFVLKFMINNFQKFIEGTIKPYGNSGGLIVFFYDTINQIVIQYPVVTGWGLGNGEWGKEQRAKSSGRGF